MLCPSCGGVLAPASQDRCPQCGRLVGALHAATSAALTPSDTPQLAPSFAATSAALSNTARHTHRRRMLIVTLVALVAVALTGIGLTLHATRAPKTAAPTSEAPLTPASPTPSSQHTPTIIFSDPMTRNTHGWAVTTNCFFGAGGYHITNRVCYVPTDAVSDATLSARIHQVRGTTSAYAGFVLRRVSAGNEYGFNIYGNGTWVFYRCITGTCQNIASAGAAAIHPGATATNTLRVAMRGAHFELYVNDIDVGGVDDTSYRGGYVGLEAGAGGEFAFSQVRITTGG